MKQEHAFAGTTAVTLIAVAGFFCIIANAPADAPVGWQHIEARTAADADSVPQPGDSK